MLWYYKANPGVVLGVLRGLGALGFGRFRVWGGVLRFWGFGAGRVFLGLGDSVLLGRRALGLGVLGLGV